MSNNPSFNEQPTRITPRKLTQPSLSQPGSDSGGEPPKSPGSGSGMMEISKSLLGCLGTAFAAVITGIFLLINNSGVIRNFFSGPSTPTVIAATPTEINTYNGAFGPITFAAGLLGNLQPIETATRFPEGITQIFAVYPYEKMTPVTPWRIEWYVNGKLLDKVAGTWTWTLIDGTTWTINWNPKGLQAGEWELRLYVGEKLTQKGFFTIVSRPANSPSFGPIQFAEGIKDNQPVNPHQPNQFFKTGTSTIVAFISAINVPKGTQWEARWSRNGDPIPNTGEKNNWTGTSDSLTSVQLNDKNGLAIGTYALKLLIQGEVVQIATFVIGE